MSEDDRGSEPRWITETIVLAIHAQQIERYGGLHGVREPNVVQSALALAQNRWAYDSSTDINDLGPSYLLGLARTQGFNDGNKRTALACALVFFALNRHALHVPPRELYALTMSAANGQADDKVVAAYLRKNARPNE